MEIKTLPLLAALLLVASAGYLIVPSAAQTLCNMTQDGLTSCRPAITVVKPVAPKPSDACCAALSHADLACLCAYKNSGWLTYLRIDPDLAMQLPAKCNLNAPTKC